MAGSKKAAPISTIKNILTLRYDPSSCTSLPKLGWGDFVERKYDGADDFVEDTIKSNIADSIGGSKKRVSLALSSGVDSTLVLLLLRQVSPKIPVTALSVKFADSVDESKQAEKIANRLDADHRVVYVANYLEELPRAISVIGLPYWDIHWYYIAKEARRFSRTLVSGDGGDELFGGYTFRYSKFLSQVGTRSSPLARARAYLECHERDWVPDQEDMFGRRARFSWRQIHSVLLPYFDNKLPPLSQVFLADYNGKLLYNWTPNYSKIHRHLGLKAVSPIISKKMIRFAAHMEPKLKYDRKQDIGKLPLRKILKKYSAEGLLAKKKQGFSVDTLNLWRSFGYDLCEYYLDESRAVGAGLINPEWIRKRLRKDGMDVRYVNKFLGILALEVWYRLFVTKEMKPSEKLTP